VGKQDNYNDGELSLEMHQAKHSVHSIFHKLNLIVRFIKASYMRVRANNPN
jgi:hypothetical protein